MIRTVRKYDHRFIPPMWGLHLGRSISRTVSFHRSCVYVLPESDQGDWNKLFGKSSLGGPHRTSYRFGWRYNIQLNLIELAMYVYQDGARSYQKIGEINFDRDYDLEIKQVGNQVRFFVNGQYSGGIVGKMPWFGRKLGAYFGGNQPAPHKMKIEIKK